MGDDAAAEVLMWCEHEVCPFADECAVSTFKKWRCWGPDVATADDRLRQHLLRCGLHSQRQKNQPDSINEAMVSATPVWKEDNMPRGRGGRCNRKRRRQSEGDGNGGDDVDDNEPKSIAAMNQDELRVIIDEMMAERMGLQGPGPRGGLGSGSAAPSQGHMVPVYRGPRPKARVFSVSEQEYRSLYDRMNRVAAAARGAQRFRGAEVLLFIYLVS